MYSFSHCFAEDIELFLCKGIWLEGQYWRWLPDFTFVIWLFCESSFLVLASMFSFKSTSMWMFEISMVNEMAILFWLWRCATCVEALHHLFEGEYWQVLAQVEVSPSPSKVLRVGNETSWYVRLGKGCRSEF